MSSAVRRWPPPTATGRFSKIKDAIGTYVRHVPEIAPDPASAQTYRPHAAGVQQALTARSQPASDDLDALPPPATEAGQSPLAIAPLNSNRA